MIGSVVQNQTRQVAETKNNLSVHDELTVRISKRLGLRMYSDTRPKNFKIADLQKGLVFVYDGIERLAEGTGFGFPVVIASGETFFSGTAQLQRSEEGNTITISKVFMMDRLARNELQNVRLENHQVRTLFGILSNAYQNHKRLRFLTLALKNIPLRLGVRTAFIKTIPIGATTVTYQITGESVKVKVDSRFPRRQIESLFVLNEQGSEFFNKYEDSQGTRLYNDQIGAWDRVNADWASMTNANNGVGFKLENKPHSVLRRGREIQKNTLDWVGLDYEIDPRQMSFEYEIKILGA